MFLVEGKGGVHEGMTPKLSPMSGGRVSLEKDNAPARCYRQGPKRKVSSGCPSLFSVAMI